MRIDGVDLRTADPADGAATAGAGAAGSGDLCRERAGERALRPARRHRGRGARRLRCRVRVGIHRAAAGALRELPGRARRAPVGRAAPAAGDRPRDPRRPSHSAARRGDQRARCGERTDGPARARAPDDRAHRAHHRAPARDRPPRRPDRGAGSRPHRRGGQPRSAADRQPALRAAGGIAVRRGRRCASGSRCAAGLSPDSAVAIQ